MKLGSFSLIGNQYLSHYGKESFLLQHPLGFQVYYIPDADTNTPFFGVGVTTPGVSTGVSHILEHGVFGRYCGAALYCNAGTAPSHTRYAMWSNQWDRILSNLLQPPMLEDERVFFREAWNTSKADENSSISHDGVNVGGIVFSEMLGVYSDPAKVTGRLVRPGLYDEERLRKLGWSQLAFMRQDSGGKPETILSLSHDGVRDYFNEYYAIDKLHMLYIGGEEDALEKIEKIVTKSQRPKRSSQDASFLAVRPTGNKSTKNFSVDELKDLMIEAINHRNDATRMNILKDSEIKVNEVQSQTQTDLSTSSPEERYPVSTGTHSLVTAREFMYTPDISNPPAPQSILPSPTFSTFKVAGDHKIYRIDAFVDDDITPCNQLFTEIVGLVTFENEWRNEMVRFFNQFGVFSGYAYTNYPFIQLSIVLKVADFKKLPLLINIAKKWDIEGYSIEQIFDLSSQGLVNGTTEEPSVEDASIKVEVEVEEDEDPSFVSDADGEQPETRPGDDEDSGELSDDDKLVLRFIVAVYNASRPRLDNFGNAILRIKMSLMTDSITDSELPVAIFDAVMDSWQWTGDPSWEMQLGPALECVEHKWERIQKRISNGEEKTVLDEIHFPVRDYHGTLVKAEPNYSYFASHVKPTVNEVTTRCKPQVFDELSDDEDQHLCNVYNDSFIPEEIIDSGNLKLVPEFDEVRNVWDTTPNKCLVKLDSELTVNVIRSVLTDLSDEELVDVSLLNWYISRSISLPNKSFDEVKALMARFMSKFNVKYGNLVRTIDGERTHHVIAEINWLCLSEGGECNDLVGQILRGEFESVDLVKYKQFVEGRRNSAREYPRNSPYQLVQALAKSVHARNVETILVKEKTWSTRMNEIHDLFSSNGVGSRGLLDKESDEYREFSRQILDRLRRILHKILEPHRLQVCSSGEVGDVEWITEVINDNQYHGEGVNEEANTNESDRKTDVAVDIHHTSSTLIPSSNEPMWNEDGSIKKGAISDKLDDVLRIQLYSDIDVYYNTIVVDLLSIAKDYDDPKLTKTGYTVGLVCQLISDHFLIPTIRMNDGAYGAWCNYDMKAGIMLISSYRDVNGNVNRLVPPTVASPLGEQCVNADLEAAVYKFITKTDSPSSALERAVRSINRLRDGTTLDTLVESRRIAASISKEEVKDLMELVRKNVSAQLTIGRIR